MKKAPVLVSVCKSNKPPHWHHTIEKYGTLKPVYPRNTIVTNRQEKFGYNDNLYPISLKAWQQLIDISIWIGLSEENQNYVIDNLREIVEKEKQ
jgi:dTDP-4-amino-4,6-dideoxygalactose transaminase